MMLKIAEAVMYVSIFSACVPLFLAIRNRKLKHRYFTLLIFLILISFVLDVSSRVFIMGGLPHLTAYLVNTYYIVQFILLALIYREFYLKENKTVLLAAAIVYFGFEITNSIFFQSPAVNQTWTWALSGAILIGMSGGYLVCLFRGTSKIYITSLASFWVNIAVTFYFGFSLYLFVMAEYVFTNATTNESIIFWAFHNFSNIVKNCLFAIAIYCGNEEDFESKLI